jgi:hypothetical protein
MNRDVIIKAIDEVVASMKLNADNIHTHEGADCFTCRPSFHIEQLQQLADELKTPTPDLQPKANKLDAARALLQTRKAVSLAQFDLDKAKQDFHAAEEEYITLASDKNDPPAEMPCNLLIDGTLIMPEESFYDHKPGKKLCYHTVEVAK